VIYLIGNTLDTYIEKTYKKLNDILKKEPINHIQLINRDIIEDYSEAIKILAQETENSKDGKEPNMIIVSDVSRIELNEMKKSRNIEEAVGARIALNGIEKYISNKENKPVEADEFNIGVKFPKNSYLILMPYSENPKFFPKLRPEFKGNDKIISVALGLKNNLGDNGDKVEIISDDNDMRTSCFQFGISSSRFEEFYKDYDYTGFVGIELDWDKKPKFCKNVLEKEITDFKIDTIRELTDQIIHPNEFIYFIGKGVDSRNYFRVNHEATKAHLNKTYFEKFRREKQEKGQKLAYTPELEQACAIDLIRDKDIDILTLSGPPGGGKTMLPLDVGLHMLSRGEIYSILVSSPPITNNIGYLPGTKEDKLRADNAKIYDNLRFLLGENGKMKLKREQVKEKIEGIEIEFEALSYIKGRTLQNSLIIFDEAEDYDPKQMRKLVSRLGRGSKMVFCGDPYQIDNPICSKTRNGLLTLISDLRDLPNYAHLTLSNNYRHPRAQVAIDRLSR